MLVKQQENINKLLGVIEELPEEKFSQLFNYAMFLLFEEKQIFTEQMFMHYSFKSVKPKNENADNKKLNIPIFSCGGMKQEFNRADLYGTKL